jgi:uncharacterized protein (DUF427 family)
MLPRPEPDLLGPGQESAWSFPRPAQLQQVAHLLAVQCGSRIIAETRTGYRVIETSHPPSYYFPPSDVDQSALIPSAGQLTQCEWKGAARYLDLVAGGRVADRAAWTYPDPTPVFAAIRDYVAFYPGRVDACFVAGERVTPQAGNFYGGWLTSHVAGPFKGPPGTEWW